MMEMLLQLNLLISVLILLKLNFSTDVGRHILNDIVDRISRLCPWAFYIIVPICCIIMLLSVFLFPRLFPDVPMLEFQVDSIEVTSMGGVQRNDYYSIVRNQKNISADLDFILTLKNKHKYFMYCNPMQVSLINHNDEFLSSTMLDPFLLFEDERPLQFGMRIKDDAHLRGETVDSISRDIWGLNVLQFGLKAQSHCIRWRETAPMQCSINVLCDDIKVAFSPANNLTTGSMIGNPLFCKCNSDCLNVRQ